VIRQTRENNREPLGGVSIALGGREKVGATSTMNRTKEVGGWADSVRPETAELKSRKLVGGQLKKHRRHVKVKNTKREKNRN